jgi:hypothetical protein
MYDALMTIVTIEPTIRAVVTGLWNMSDPAIVKPTCMTIFDAAKLVGDVLSKSRREGDMKGSFGFGQF